MITEMRNMGWLRLALMGVLLGVGCSESSPEGKMPQAMDECEGGRLDPDTRLCWQEGPHNEEMNGYQAAGILNEIYNPDKEDYCGDLNAGGHTDWRLPDADELISLLRGCRNGIATETLQRSSCAMTPEDCVETGACGYMDQCEWCADEPPEGPGESGCYRDPSLNGPCRMYWSSTSHLEFDYDSWNVDFNLGSVVLFPRMYPSHARCVRGPVGDS